MVKGSQAHGAEKRWGGSRSGRVSCSGSAALEDDLGGRVANTGPRGRGKRSISEEAEVVEGELLPGIARKSRRESLVDSELGSGGVSGPKEGDGKSEIMTGGGQSSQVESQAEAGRDREGFLENLMTESGESGLASMIVDSKTENGIEAQSEAEMMTTGTGSVPAQSQGKMEEKDEGSLGNVGPQVKIEGAGLGKGMMHVKGKSSGEIKTEMKPSDGAKAASQSHNDIDVDEKTAEQAQSTGSTFPEVKSEPGVQIKARPEVIASCVVRSEVAGTFGVGQKGIIEQHTLPFDENARDLATYASKRPQSLEVSAFPV